MKWSYFLSRDTVSEVAVTFNLINRIGISILGDNSLPGARFRQGNLGFRETMAALDGLRSGNNGKFSEISQMLWKICKHSTF